MAVKETVNDIIPFSSVNPPSTADVQAPQVIPSTERVVVARSAATFFAPPVISVDKTVASKPRFSILNKERKLDLERAPQAG